MKPENINKPPLIEICLTLTFEEINYGRQERSSRIFGKTA